TDHAHGHAIGSSRQLSGKVELQFATRLCTGHFGPKYLQSEKRLPDATGKVMVCSNNRKHGQMGEVGVVHRTPIAEQIEQQKARQADAILRSAFNFGLILVIYLGAEQLQLLLKTCGRVRPS